MILRGKVYDGKSTATQDRQIELGTDQMRMIAADSEAVSTTNTFALNDLKISDRIADTPRRVRFPNGMTFETLDNDKIDDWLKTLRRHSFRHRIHQVERHWWTTLAAAGLIAVISWVTIRFGVPLLANIAARAIPESVDSKLGADGLSLLDRSVFALSTLPIDKQNQVRALFHRMTADIDPSRQYRLEFRRSNRVGANAFALPGGVVVVTDQLVELTDDSREIQAVLSHEIGHVVNRHGLRTLLQASSASTLTAAIFGDFSSLSTLVAAAPVLLVEASYSRQFENEADDFAYAWMKAHDIPTHFFGDILLKLESSHNASGQEGSNFFSSHPRTGERVSKE